MVNTKYNMAFTTGGLLFLQSIKLAELYFNLKDWTALRKQVNQQNLLQTRSQNTSTKIYTEISSRLKRLSTDELNLLVNGSRQDQYQLLWLAICKKYRFIFEFATEVLREKFLQLNPVLLPGDYDSFFLAKAEWDEKLENLANETKKKLKQVVFKIMRDTELISKENQIIPAVLSPQVAAAIIKHSPDFLSIFPASEGDIRAWAL